MVEVDFGPHELNPPAYLIERGIPVFDGQAMFDLLSVVPAWSGIGDVPTLSTRGLAQTLQWTAPGHMLGSPPAPPRVRREDVLAVSVGERQAVMDTLDGLLVVGLREPCAGVTSEGSTTTTRRSRSTSIFPGQSEWRPLVTVGDRPALALGEWAALVPRAAHT